MKRAFVILAVCLPVLLVTAVVVFEPARMLLGLAILKVWHPGPPPILGSVLCQTEGKCKSEGNAFTNLLVKRFPPRTPDEKLKDLLSHEKFSSLGDNAEEYNWAVWPCLHDVIVEWTSDDQQKILKVTGYYALTCR